MHGCCCTCVPRLYDANAQSTCPVGHRVMSGCSLASLHQFKNATHQYNAIFLWPLNTAHCTPTCVEQQYWIRGLFTPWVAFCSSNANFDDVYGALQNNTQAFRDHYGLPSCSQAPTTDITCLARSCPVSEASTQLQLGTFIVYIFQMV